MINVVLCGGSGTRLWPISRKLLPKQFLRLFNGKSLFQETIIRNNSFSEKQLIVINEELYFQAIDQIDELKKSNVKVPSEQFLLEPVGRNTAPAISLACMALNQDEIIMVTPSDHIVKDIEAYKRVVLEAENFANQGNLVTFGIKPEYPETGYGYIEAEKNTVINFHEKPSLTLAKEYVKKGNYYWNSGIFCFKAGVFLNELKAHSSEIFKMAQKAYLSANKNNMIRIKHEDMVNIPSNSIDYAVMEKSTQVKVVPSDISWNDLGSFDSLYNELPRDESGNTKNPDTIFINSKNNLIFSSSRKIATIDINDLIIVDTHDALLISPRGSSQKVKDIVDILKKSGSELPNVHITAYRPWGNYTVLENSDRYQVKRIVVKPGKRLSLQKHFHRNEHWIVVSGTAIITIGDEKKILRTNESTYIKMGEMHRLENQGKVDLVLIEAQLGEYLGEDDIVRIQDDFNRINHS